MTPRLPVASTAVFSAAVGNTNALSALNVSAAQIHLNGGSVNTTGNQRYAGAVTLAAGGRLGATTYVQNGAGSTLTNTGGTVTTSGNYTQNAGAGTSTGTIQVGGAFALVGGSFANNAGGTRVVFPAPGGASKTRLAQLRSCARTSPRRGSTGRTSTSTKVN